MMNNTHTEARTEPSAPDVVLALATMHELYAPDIAREPPGAFVRRECSPFLTPAHVDVTQRPARYAKPKPFVFPTRKQLRNMSADRWMRQRFNAAKTASYNELSAVESTIDNRAALAARGAPGRSPLESIGRALINASRCLRFTKKTVH